MTPVSTGWCCPGCGRCYAPWVAVCVSCPAAVTAINTNPIPPYPKPSPNQCAVPFQKDTPGLGGTTR